MLMKNGLTIPFSNLLSHAAVVALLLLMIPLLRFSTLLPYPFLCFVSHI